jgi:hypothetical protein
MQSKFDSMPLVSTPLYFKNLLYLLKKDQYQAQLLQGFSSSIGLGSESVLKASRLGLVMFLKQNDHKRFLTPVCEIVTEVAKANLKNERVVAPALLTIAYFFEAGLAQQASISFKSVMLMTAKVHYQTKSFHRLDAAVRIYASLAEIDETRLDARTKLANMLLHPFPRVRNQAADLLYVIFTLERDEPGKPLSALSDTDWNQDPKSLKLKATMVKGLLV